MGESGSAERYTDNYYQAVCCFAHTAPLLLTLRALPALHVVHHLRPLHPMQHVHQCRTFTTTVRGSTGTAWNGGAVESLRRLGPRPTASLSSRIHSWKYDPKGGAIEAA